MTLVTYTNKFRHYLAKPIITRITVSLVLETVIIRAALYCFQRFYDFG